MATLSTTPTEPVAVAGTTTDPTVLDRARVGAIAIDIARSIPAVRKAELVIAGTLGTFPIVPIKGIERQAVEGSLAWLNQPQPGRTRQWIVTRTILDVLWYDRCVWKITDRTLFGSVSSVERVHPNRVQTIPHPMDPDTIETLIVDSQSYTDWLSAGYVIFDGAGLGGLQRFGYELLTLYGDLQTAASRYAKRPHPYAILKNHGADLPKEKITKILEEWGMARESTGIGYTNDVLDYEPQIGYSAKELQLTEAREYAALEVARLFGLPAFSLDARTGDSMTYANTVDRRKDELRSLSPWRTVFEQTLSMDDRRGRPSGVLLPHGTTAVLDAQEYVREDAKTRMETWNAALEREVLTLDEVRAAEPLAGVNR